MDLESANKNHTSNSDILESIHMVRMKIKIVEVS